MTKQIEATTLPFVGFQKLPRFSREVIITEKLDGTNAQVYILTAEEAYNQGVLNQAVSANNDWALFAGSRNRWLSPQNDNSGFALWCSQNFDELLKLGHGRHFGEWWGQGIQRNYGLKEKRFSLFNVSRWLSSFADPQQPGVNYLEKDGSLVGGPGCVYVVPTLWQGLFDTADPHLLTSLLATNGSFAAPGFMDPEGIVIWHVAGNVGFKKTIKHDESRKGLFPVV